MLIHKRPYLLWLCILLTNLFVLQGCPPKNAREDRPLKELRQKLKEKRAERRASRGKAPGAKTPNRPEEASLAEQTGAKASSQAGELAWITTDDGVMQDTEGRQVILRGFVTLTHNSDNTKVDYSPADYQRMRRMGSNYQSIRVFAGVLGAWPGRKAYPAYLDRVDRMVRLAKQAGVYSEFKLTMYDIKDFGPEHWGALWKNANGEQQALIRAWTLVWERYKDDPAVIGYDLLNEPEQGDLAMDRDRFCSEYLVPFYQKAIDALRAIDTRHLAFIQPPLESFDTKSGLVSYSPLPVSVNRSGIVYSPHFYLSLFGFDTKDYQRLMDRYAKEAKRNRAPLFIGEYGMVVYDKLDSDDTMKRRYRASEEMASALFDRHGIGVSRPWYSNDRARVGKYINWAVIRGTNGLAGEERTYVTDVFARPYPQRLAGTLDSFDYDFAQRRFTLKYSADPQKGTSIIYLPRQRHFAQGFVARYSSGLQVTHDASTATGLRVLENPNGVAVDALQWDESNQLLLVKEWAKQRAEIVVSSP